MSDFITPPNHVGFLAKKLFAEQRELVDVAIAYLEPQGGGPVEPHTHSHDHLFIVTEGEARIMVGGEAVIVKKDCSYLVSGKIPHAVWNNSEGVTVMIGATLK